jgi:hypothetical protein
VTDPVSDAGDEVERRMCRCDGYARLGNVLAGERVEMEAARLYERWGPTRHDVRCYPADAARNVDTIEDARVLSVLFDELLRDRKLGGWAAGFRRSRPSERLGYRMPRRPHLPGGGPQRATPMALRAARSRA